MSSTCQIDKQIVMLKKNHKTIFLYQVASGNLKTQIIILCFLLLLHLIFEVSIGIPSLDIANYWA